MDLQVEIGEINKSLASCIKDYLKEESNVENYTCEECSSTSGTKKLSLYITPDLLIISLKRFKFNPDTRQIRKLCTAIKFPEILDLCETVTGPNKNQSTYSLYAISNHLGDSIQFGHYITHCRHPKKDAWFVLNDSDVSLCSNPEVEIFSSKNNTAYILFYKRVEQQADQQQQQHQADQQQHQTDQQQHQADQQQQQPANEDAQ
jgi:ubiquitin C-terminal hydrolase